MGCQQDHPDYQTCTECEFDPFVRNHFFTGKMMGAGEFITEAHYHAEKLRHHNLRLHGWGVVCGLRVRQHPSPDCRTRYVLVDPGTALDCCGHEILVTRQEILDVGQHPAVKQKTADGLLHALQIAVCYRECPTEEVPVLYDECGCDDTQCAPNRILESFTYDVLVDPPLSFDFGVSAALGAFVTSDVHGATGLMRATAVGKVAVIDPGNAQRAFVLDPAHRSLVAVTLPAAARALAMAPDGVRFFVVTDPVAPGTLCEVHVYQTSDGAEVPTLVAGAVRTLPGTTAASTFAAATTNATARRLLVLDRTGGQFYLWPEDTTAGIADADNGTPIAIAAGSRALTATEDGAFGFTIDAAGVVQVTDFAASTVTPLAGLPAGAKPNALAAFVRGTDAMLAVASGVESRIYLVNHTANTLAATITLAHQPVFLHASSGAAPWLTIYEEEAGHAYVQSVALANLPPLLSAPRSAGSGGRRIVLIHADGQASLVDVAQLAEGDCASLLCHQMDGCCGCDTPKCVVLATLANYLPNMQMLDLPAVASDLGNQITRIDNRRGRRVLASTATLQAWLQCLQLKGGVPGPAGPPGAPGINGINGINGTNGLNGTNGKDGAPGVIDVKLDLVDCSTPPALTLNGQVLTLTLPKCCDGDLAHICDINWPHAGVIGATKLRGGLTIAFDRPLDPADCTNGKLKHCFIVETMHAQQIDDRLRLECWCQLIGEYRSLELDTLCTINSGPKSPMSVVTAITFMPSPGFLTGQTYRVRLLGDLIRDDKNKRAVDADHLPPWVPNRKSGDCIEGGTFESWFTVK